MPAIDLNIDSSIGIVTLGDSARGNRLNRESLEALLEAVRSCIERDDIRIILLRSDGDAFCLGMDLLRLQTASEADGDAAMKEAADSVAAYAELLDLIHDARKAVVAVVRGPVKAGGVGLVSACDVVIVSEEASFELGEALFGLIPANVLPFLLRLRVPLQKARYLILTAACVDGQEAHILGLADEVFPPDGLEKGLRGVLRRMLRTSPDAVAETKRFTRRLLESDLGSASREAQSELLELMQRDSVLEAVRAFNEGETPPWFAKLRPAGPLSGEGSA